ncbi:MAG: biotin transporter BioY [Candidatus Paceibacterota bacterium]|jgi:biotin transporter BioY
MTTLINDIKIENKIFSLSKEILFILGFAFLTGISANMKLEIGMVPITMQTFVVLLSGALLGSKKGAFSQVAYLLMGLSGVFWFARGGGPLYLLSPTFGYIIGFVLASFAVGFLCEKGFDRRLDMILFALIVGDILIYIPGLLCLSGFIGIEKALLVGFYPFISGDILKIFLAGAIVSIVKKRSFCDII